MEYEAYQNLDWKNDVGLSQFLMYKDVERIPFHVHKSSIIIF